MPLSEAAFLDRLKTTLRKTQGLLAPTNHPSAGLYHTGASTGERVDRIAKALYLYLNAPGTSLIDYGLGNCGEQTSLALFVFMSDPENSSIMSQCRFNILIIAPDTPQQHIVLEIIYHKLAAMIDVWANIVARSQDYPLLLDTKIQPDIVKLAQAHYQEVIRRFAMHEYTASQDSHLIPARTLLTGILLRITGSKDCHWKKMTTFDLYEALRNAESSYLRAMQDSIPSSSATMIRIDIGTTGVIASNQAIFHNLPLSAPYRLERQFEEKMTAKALRESRKTTTFYVCLIAAAAVIAPIIYHCFSSSDP